LDSKVLVEMICKVIGGLGIFLLGMRYMSDGLQTIAGPSLRKMIASVTGNRIMACLVGIFVTCLVQSSSVSTVMAIGLVNSGIMTLTQAIGVVLGANIGTTVTGWILVLEIGKWGLPMIGIASFFFLFSKREKTRFLALAIVGVGMVFFGLELMKSGFKPMRNEQSFIDWFHAFQATSYIGVLKCVAVGCLLTFIVQSSSATLGITIGLAYEGLLDFETAGALVLGENIGTTITAILASIGASTNARRAAYFHVLFNVIGVFWITLLFPYYLEFIHFFVDKFSGISNISADVMVDGQHVKPYTTMGIATVHSIFNVTNVLLFLPFTSFFAAFLLRFVPERKQVEKLYLTHLDFTNFDTGFAAIEQSAHEIQRMSKHTANMSEHLDGVIKKVNGYEELAKSIFEREAILDTVQKEITGFLSEVKRSPLSHELVLESNIHLVLCDEYESISDEYTQILKMIIRLRDNEIDLLDNQKTELLHLSHKIHQLFKFIINENNNKSIQEVHIHSESEGHEIKDVIRQYRNNHWHLLSGQNFPPLLATTYTDILASYRKIIDHLIHITESKSGHHD
jgi:phosphate:Na+ symporter